VVTIPLKDGDADAELDLQIVVSNAYERAAYDLGINYLAEPTPPLSPEYAAWANALLTSKGLRG
jgi:hypothetical protein